MLCLANFKEKYTMANFVTEEFKTYKVFLLSGIENDASIHIKLPSGVAVIRFVSGSSNKNSVEPSKSGDKIFKVYTSMTNFPHYIDILRNEAPLFFFYDLDDQVSYITTTDEPVGEGEWKVMS